MKKLAMMVIGLMVMAGAQAQLLRYEDFTTSSGEGTRIGRSGTPGDDGLSSTNDWTYSGTGPQGPRTALSDLLYSGLQTGTGGGKAFLNNTNTATTTSAGQCVMGYENQTGALYASFLMRVTDLGTVGTSWTLDGTFFHQYSSADSNIIGIRDNGAGGFELRFSGTSANFTAGTSVYTTGALSLNTTYLVVVGTDSTSASGIWKVWINPVSLGGTEPTPTSTAAAWRGSANNTAVRLGDDDNALPLPSMYVDDVRVGTTYADVTPAGGTPAPQPGSVVIIK